MDHLKFSSLLCSQVFHDLAGPIGVIDNTLDLVSSEDLSDFNLEEFNFISKSAKQAVIQLKFLRVLFGNTPSSIDLNDAFKLSNEYLNLKNVKLTWSKEKALIESDAVFVKLIMSFFYGSKVVLPYGGDIQVFYISENNIEIKFLSKKIIDDEKILNLINCNSIKEPPDSKLLPFVFISLLSNRLGLKFKKISNFNQVIYKAKKII